jgi:hypothetical protein
MIRSQTWKNILSIALFSFVNMLFILKYASRIGTAPALALLCAYALFCAIASVLAARLPERRFKRGFGLACAAAFTISFLVALRFIKVDVIMNDRWSVINEFFDHLFRGIYPYLAQSNQANQPGPFPFYFVVVFPFYLIKEIGVVSLFAFLALFAVLARQGAPARTLVLQTALLVTSPALAYEIAARSTVFVNMTLVVLYMYWLEKKVLPGARRRLWLPAILGGFLLSTRAVTAIPLACYLSYSLLRRKELFAYAKLAAGMAAGFCITFVPLMFWGWHAFTQKNPLLLQSCFSPLPLTAAAMVAAVTGGLFVRRFETCLLLCGGIVFAVVAVATILFGLEFGWQKGFYESKFDISYFIFCVPFLVASLRIPEPRPEG